jgi:hypothetical protein
MSKMRDRRTPAQRQLLGNKDPAKLRPRRSDYRGIDRPRLDRFRYMGMRHKAPWSLIPRCALHVFTPAKKEDTSPCYRERMNSLRV